MWTLTIKNFAYLREESFEINQDSLTLISGENGSGKSTIMKALTFAFYGSRVRSISTFGESKGSIVTLDMGESKIVRTSSPKSIKVYVIENDQTFCFENEAAEEYITKKIVGQTFEQFVLGSYRRNAHSSIISMTPAEQLKFIENLAFSDDTHILIKNAIKKQIDHFTKLENKYDSQLLLLNEQLVTLKNSVSNMNIDENTISKFEEAKINESAMRQKIQSIVENINLKTKEKKNLDDKIKQFSLLNEKLLLLKNTLSLHQTQLSNIENNPNFQYLDKISEIEIHSDQLGEQIKYAREYQKWNEIYQKLEEMKKMYYEGIQTERDKYLTDPKYLSQEKIDDLRFFKKQLEEYTDIYNKKQQAKNVIIDIHKKFQERNIKTGKLAGGQAMLDFLENYKKTHFKIFECPNCKCLVSTDTNQIVKVKEESPFNEQEVEDFIFQTKNILPNFDLVTPKLVNPEKLSVEGCIVKISEAEQLEFQRLRCQNALNNKNLPPQFKNVIATEQKLRLAIPKNYIHNTEIDISQLEIEFSKSVHQLEELLKLQSEVDKYKKLIGSLVKEINSVEKQLSHLDDNNFTNQITTIEIEITNLETTRWQLERQLEQISTFIDSQKDIVEKLNVIKNIKSVEQEIVNCTAQNDEVKKKLSGFSGLSSVAKLAEITAVETIITRINEYATTHLSQLFDIPIIVQLRNKKETQKKEIRDQMSVYIFYKNHEYPSFEDMSDGEQQRCNLAFLLAVNDLVDSNILMLDECLNHLHQESNSHVIDYLKEISNKKTILVIAHEAVKGLFDYEINMKKYEDN